MDVCEMTAAEIREMPDEPLDYGEEIRGNALIICPRTKADGLHDSGYRYIDVILEQRGNRPRRLGTWSDVIHIDGIGGYGLDWSSKGGIPLSVPVRGWSIDCLPKSGLCRLFPMAGQILIRGAQMSSFEVYAVDRPVEAQT